MKVVRKDIKTGDLVLKRKKNWEKPGKTSWILGRAIHSKRNRHVRGFSFVRADRRRVAIFVECWQPEKVLPLKVPVVTRCNLEYFSFFASLHSKKWKKFESRVYKWFRGKQ
jgi:hypothetical protein